MGRIWVPLIIVLVLLGGGFAVSRLHGVFGSQTRPVYSDTPIADSKTFDPKHLTYEVFGPPGTVAMISFFDGDGEPRTLRDVSLPWSQTFDVGQTTAVGSLMAQGDSDTIGCRITVNDEVKAERTTHQPTALTYCLLKAA
ncbi:MAG: MmpS family transport accessory protein [Mycolicibacterium insubricum]